LTRGEAISAGGSGNDTPIDLTAEQRAEPTTRTLNGTEHHLYIVTCPGSGTQFRYVPAGITATDLIPGITNIIEGQLQPPVPDINPTPEANGIVNLGLWLAVQPQTLPPLTAAAGPAWITVTPALTTTHFDLGNSDTVTCTGTGTSIDDVHPDHDVLEQSPTCGYTYRHSSPDDRPYQLTITTTWTLPYTSSNGTGTIPAIDRTLTIDYDVDEIQTLGVSN
jgi:hypothetical protein